MGISINYPKDCLEDVQHGHKLHRYVARHVLIGQHHAYLPLNRPSILYLYT